MAPAYKLTYFPVKAVGEPLRFLLSYGGLEFEDVRVEEESWSDSDLKKKMPFGQVPVLEVNGKMAHQSIAMARYLAKQVKLVGQDDWENLEIDAIVDTLNDLRGKMGTYHYEEDAAIKKSLKEPLFKEILPYYLGRLDTIAKNNKGHFAVAKLTWADFVFVGWLDYLDFMIKGDLIADYPNLQLVKKKVLELPAIKAWVAKRPQSES